MIETKIETKQKKMEFPVLLQGNTTDLIVLATNEDRHCYCGMVLHSDGGPEIGDWNETWDKADFTLFDGTITLKNNVS